MAWECLTRGHFVAGAKPAISGGVAGLSQREVPLRQLGRVASLTTTLLHLVSLPSKQQPSLRGVCPAHSV